MTAPDAQPPADTAPPAVWWSEGHGVIEANSRGEFVMRWWANKTLSALPADAVRLVAEPTDCNAIVAAHALCDSAARGVVQAFDNAAWVSNGPVAAAINHLRAALAGTTTPTDERADLLERLNQVIDLSRRLDSDDLDPSVEPITDPERDVWGAAALLRSALHRYGIAVRDEYWALLASTPTEETDR